MKTDEPRVDFPPEEQFQTAGRRPPPDWNEPARGRRGWLVWLLVLAVLAAAGWFIFKRVREGQVATAASAHTGPRSFPVVAGRTIRGDMPIFLDGLGTVTAFETVTLHSRVDGELMQVYFKEGQIVQKDQLLAQIDPRPFQVQLTQAEGQLAKDQAQLQNAQLDLKRYVSIKESITQQQIDTQKATVEQDEGAVKSDQGQIDNAKLQLVYSRITAPLTGRIGLRLVDPGNIVHASDVNGLLVITQLQPIAVYFYLREDDIREVLPRLARGATLEVIAMDHDLTTELARGTLLATDNQVDPSTGTLRFKAVFPNTDYALFPNEMVNARLLVDTLKNVVIAPSAAIQHGPNNSTFVYVVKNYGASPTTAPTAAPAPTTSPAGGPPKEYTVELRNITTGHQEGDQIVIEKGLSSGEVVVTDGVDKLEQGSHVTVRLQRPTTRPTVRAAGATTRPAGEGPAKRSGKPGRRSGS